jgi:3-methyladenine DNA glycosylase/8-oxoguanine DNA glycosylase
MTLNLAAQPPFSLASVALSHGWFQLAPFSLDEANGDLIYVDQLSTGRVVKLVMHDSVDGVSVNPNASLYPDEQIEVSHKVAWMLDLERDLAHFYTLVGQEPKLAHVASRLQGRLLRAPTLFEDTVKTILTTNTAWSGTIRMVARLVAQFGAPLEDDPELRAFPSPVRLAASSEDELRAAASLGYRAPYVLELARNVQAGVLDLEALKTSDLSTGELRKQLLSIKGVGDYAAANLLMLLGRFDFIPIDSWALKVVSREWYNGEPVGRSEVEAVFEPWGEWRGLAYWFWNWSDQG